MASGYHPVSAPLKFLIPGDVPRAWPADVSARGVWALVIDDGAEAQDALNDLFPAAVSMPSSSTRVVVRAFKPGVANPMATSLGRALGISERRIRVDRLLFIDDSSRDVTATERARLEWLWREPAIEELRRETWGDWAARNAVFPRAPVREDTSFAPAAPGDFGLEFEPAETAVLRAEAERNGRPWTRAELEVFAQTWSEHCKHKIFGARIRTRDTRNVETNGLFGTHIRKPSLEIAERRPGRYLSLFHDNAGVLALDDERGQPTGWAYCLKMETHNSPSAISPYGGASTGLVGVHRDILGTGRGALPIANWDVLCFESPDHREPRPEGALPADVIREGVLRGIEDGGNQSGIPTVQGSVVFDPSYAVKPLVFAGSVGLLPKGDVDKKPQPGLEIFAIGGPTGADGLRGAVMSSRDLRSDDFGGSAVQVASPFVQRCLTDFLIDARDRGLIDVVTDNGAGGFASSVGEMASLANGADIELAGIRLKQDGLHAWERLLSESQERMTIATSQPEAFMTLAQEWRVDFDRLGRLTDTGRFRVTFEGRVFVDIPLAFLHDGCPRLELTADWDASREETELLRARGARAAPRAPDAWQDFAALLASPHLCSREGIVRRFDHEVQGRTLRKPFGGRTQRTPQDGSLVDIPEQPTPASLCLAHGLAPWRRRMEWQVLHAFDETIRHALLAGGRLDTAGLLDNFCWPDPIVRGAGPEHRRLWRLVRACETLADLARAFEIPFVSGKDSMKNNSRDFAVIETLVVSLGASARARETTPAGFFSRGNEVVFWVPPLALSFEDSTWERVFGAHGDALAPPDTPALIRDLKRRYEGIDRALARGLVRSAKDIGEGGLLTTVFEMCLGRDLGFLFERKDESLALLGEGLGGFVFAIDPHVIEDFQSCIPDARRLGVVYGVPMLRWGPGVELPIANLREAYERLPQKGLWQ